MTDLAESNLFSFEFCNIGDTLLSVKKNNNKTLKCNRSNVYPDKGVEGMGRVGFRPDSERKYRFEHTTAFQ